MQNSIHRLKERNNNIRHEENPTSTKNNLYNQTPLIHAQNYKEFLEEEESEEEEENRRPRVDPEKEEILKENELLKDQITRQERDYGRMELDLEKKIKEIEIEGDNILRGKIRELEEENSRLKGQVDYIVSSNPIYYFN